MEKRIGRRMTEANDRYQLFGPGDRILVGVSGGKDSYTLLHMLRRCLRLAPFDFEIVAYHLAQGQPGFPSEKIESYLLSEGYETVIERQNTYQIVVDKLRKDATPCSLCSRLRRGIMYKAANRLGCTRIALGHHREDLIETLLLNLFYAGRLESMPPKLRNDAGDQVVIRPLAHVPETWIAEFAVEQGFPIAPCLFCETGSRQRRKQMGELIQTLAQDNPYIQKSIMSAMANIHPSHLLDGKLFEHRQL